MVVFGLVAVLALIAAAFLWLVQTAKLTVPQPNEIISPSQAAEQIRAGQVERVLIQEERDIFLYLPSQARPLYTRLEAGQSFTGTFEALGVSAGQFPPLTVESD